MAEARKLAAALAAKAPIADPLHPRAVNRGLEMPLAQAQVFEATLFGLVAEHRRHARGHRGVSRKAQAGVQGASSVREQDQPPAPLGDAPPFRFAVIVSRFNEAITGACATRARAALAEAGARRTCRCSSVPGAFEIPQAARAAAETGRFDAVVCLGCVIRGETPHFDYIASAVAHGIMDAAGDTGVPMAFGVLTTDTVEQAAARAGPGRDNKGWEAAAAAIEMAALYRRSRARARPDRVPFGFAPP